MSGANVSQLVSLAATQKGASALASQLVTLAATGSGPSRWVNVPQLVSLSVVEHKTMTDVSQLVSLAVWTTGPRETLNSRAWGFTFDGHPFYVLHLGNSGTWVYDISTQQWAQWQTEGVVTWNMEYGTTWNGEVVAGDQATNEVWRLDPASFLDDDFRPIRRVVTGGYPVTGRDGVSAGIFTLEASPQGSDIDELSTVTLSLSDDRGQTFSALDTLTVSGDEEQDLSWGSLGKMKAPGRVFKIEDSGGLVRIDGAELTVGKPRTKPKSG